MDKELLSRHGHLQAGPSALPFLRLVPSQRWRPYHRLQHLYAWPLYCTLALKWWFVDDLVDLARGRIGPVAFQRPRGVQFAIMLAGKVVFLGWAVVVPTVVFRSSWVALLFLLGAAVLGFVLSIVFQLAHTVSGARFETATRLRPLVPPGSHSARRSHNGRERLRLDGMVDEAREQPSGCAPTAIPNFVSDRAVSLAWIQNARASHGPAGCSADARVASGTCERILTTYRSAPGGVLLHPMKTIAEVSGSVIRMAAAAIAPERQA